MVLTSFNNFQILCIVGSSGSILHQQLIVVYVIILKSKNRGISTKNTQANYKLIKKLILKILGNKKVKLQCHKHHRHHCHRNPHQLAQHDEYACELNGV